MSHWRQHNFAEDEMPEQLVPVECPEPVKYIWGYFLSMSFRRSSNGYHYNPLSEQDVLAWAKRRGIELLPFENKLIDAVERVFLRIRNKKKDEDE